MSVVIVTGSSGLVGSAVVERLSEEGLDVVGIDNDMRKAFFGEDASTAWNARNLQIKFPAYTHHAADIRDRDAMAALFRQVGEALIGVVHCAGQPSHDWAATDPFTDFSVNAEGTLILLEMLRNHAPDAAFVFLSTNKVYGDRPNDLPLIETDTRWELDRDHPYFEHGIDESMSIDASKHSLFGVSKTAADLMVQEYGRYFGLKTACLRCGCLTGPAQAGAQLHGFLSYLMRCAVTGRPYTVFGYKAKQVRDNIHSRDLADAIWHIVQSPRSGAVYNMGGGRHSNCSMLEAIDLAQEISGNDLDWRYSEDNRSGDHIWWISDLRRFQADYPEWAPRYDLGTIMLELHHAQVTRAAAPAALRA